MKKLLVFTLLIIVTLGYLKGQSVQISTANPGVWTAAVQAGSLNATPPNIAGLVFNVQPTTYNPPCNSNVNTNPAPQIRANANCQPGTNTFFYSTTFNLALNTNSYCASFSIRADDAFRVYVNGTQIAGGLTLSGCNGTVMTQLNGNTWQNVFTFNNAQIQPLLVTGQNTVVIEVSNCTTISYLSALLNFNTFTNGFSPIHYSVTQGNNMYTTNLWGTSSANIRMMGLGGSGTWMGNWLIESGPTANGPWTYFANTQENTSAQTMPWNPPSFSYGTYYRVTYTITTSCGPTASYTLTIWIACQGCLISIEHGNPFLMGNAEAIKYMDDKEKFTFPDDVVIEDVFTNPPSQFDSLSHFQSYSLIENIIEYVSMNESTQILKIKGSTDTHSEGIMQVEIYGITGNLVWRGNTSTTSPLEINVKNWTTGIYVVHVVNNIGLRECRKIVIRG